MDCLIEVATRGDRDSMIKVARAFDTGVNLGSARYDFVILCFQLASNGMFTKSLGVISPQGESQKWL